MKYRIMESHCGDPSEVYKSFNAKNDEEARKELRRLRKDPQFGYSFLYLIQVEQEEIVSNVIG